MKKYNEATDDYLFDQGEKLEIPENSVLEIILACVKIGLFCEEFFMEHRILTSKSIQDRFSLATKTICKSNSWIQLWFCFRSRNPGFRVGNSPKIGFKYTK